jgi:hypothetical protein
MLLIKMVMMVQQPEMAVMTPAYLFDFCVTATRSVFLRLLLRL